KLNQSVEWFYFYVTSVSFSQTALPSRKGFRHQTTKFLYRLVGSEDMAVDQSIVSPYTSRILKPYIRCTERRSHVECRGACPPPGVDLSECLQYPDFSVVVLYKKVIIAFGFMVPDVKYNEAYISFLFVHPEWRRAGIATFMIYHLIQTCMGKDVTLHVSASNPAMLLYQKFGFKTEEYVLDFYDKYYPLESTECKHAFFLRLRR
ncbi:Cysteine-rich protein 2-binding protein, partial [Camelus dromedarius]